MSAPIAHSLVSVVIPMYRDGERALATSRALALQVLPADTRLEIIVVDDGSGDGSAELLAAEPVRLIRLPENRGRSAARNAGAEAASGSVIVFMDCDCLPSNEAFLTHHLERLRAGALASTGHVTGSGAGFWDRYQREASLKREYLHSNGLKGSGSSQNLAVLTSAFKALGGFDELYRCYGFEDRDLLLRLAAAGTVAWAPDAEVRHLDDLSLREVGAKMFEAAKTTAPIFVARHPAAYKALGYAAVDARRHPWLLPVGRILGPITQRLGVAIDPLLRHGRLPYFIGKHAVRIVSALSFLYGTSCDASDRRSP